jgi:NitT/TauT family transport system ATP-binding protein
MASKPDLGIHIRLNEVSARHSGDVVGPLSLEIGRRELLSLIGPGNCGKSLLLRVIAGLEPLISGSIDFVCEKDPGGKDMGFVFRDSVLLPWRSVLGNVTLEAEIRGLDRRTSEQQARRLMAAMSLGGIEDRPPHDLQFEETQRAAICRALLHNPALLLMDDPFGRMDFEAREHLVADFQRLWMESRFAVVLVTEDIDEAVQLSDRVVLMSRSPGRILQTLEIDLPRPRRLDKATTPQIAEYSSRIRTIFRAQGLPY